VFLGKFARTLDARNRVTVPAPFKADLAGEAYMTQGFDRNVQVLTTRAFQHLYDEATSLNVADPLTRLLLRLLLGSAVHMSPSKTSLPIPDNLKEYASLSKDVLLIGQGNYFEIWAPELWSEQEARMRDAEANASRFAELNLGTARAPSH
jgi:MraZ protein